MECTVSACNSYNRLMVTPPGSVQNLHIAASALAVGMKVGAIREGASAREFASELGLGESDAVAASELATRRALTASPDLLIPSASAFNRIVEQLEAIRAGAGKRWSKRVLDTSRDGMTATAAWVRSLGIRDNETLPIDSAAQISSQIELPGQASGVVQPFAAPSIIDGSGPAEAIRLTFDEDWTEEDAELELDDDDDESEAGDGRRPSDEAVEDLLADDSVDLDDDWMNDKPAT
jgi:hypothetical protein